MDQATQNSPPQEQKPKPNQKSGKKIGMAVIAYIIFFVPLLTDVKDDPFVKFHVKQGTVLFIGAVVVWLISRVLPIIGWIISPLLNIAVLVLAIIGIINAVNGDEKPLPLIGHFSSYLKF